MLGSSRGVLGAVGAAVAEVAMTVAARKRFLRCIMAVVVFVVMRREGDMLLCVFLSSRLAWRLSFYSRTGVEMRKRWNRRLYL